MRSVRVMRLVFAHRLPRVLEQFFLREQRITEETFRVDALRGVVRTGINAARNRQLGAEVARVRLERGRFFLLDFHLRRDTFDLRFDLRPDLLRYVERMHVDVAVRTKLGAFPAADAPVLDDDFEALLPAN